MNISVNKTSIKDVKIIKPELLEDQRGFFVEIFRKDIYEQYSLPHNFVQMNHSGSVKGVLRGLHFQWEPPMGKLIWVSKGEGFLVAVDIRLNSPTLGEYVSITSNQKNKNMIWAPAGFARGFLALSEWAELQYLTTGTYNGNAEGNIAWNDNDIKIDWPIEHPIISDRDNKAPKFKEWLISEQAKYLMYDPENILI